MKMNANTDFLYRSMIYVALHSDRLVTTREIAEAFGLSLNHIAKVTQELIKMGLLEGQRGRRGGVRLARPAEEIKLGELMGPAKGDSGVIDCQNGIGGPCRILPVCRLKGIFAQAHGAFLSVLNQHTLADLVGTPQMQKALIRLLNAEDLPCGG
ncbi:Rrf2 family transcriptional regulator [Akkermansiaceae bacterium]|nr:Rrf2 family transcriptional regulator [Akkermansiaceae bacterium]